MNESQWKKNTVMQSQTGTQNAIADQLQLPCTEDEKQYAPNILRDRSHSNKNATL